MTDARTIIETIDITKVYGMGDIRVAALNGVSVKIEAGEFVAIMGPSGSGKSTLMHILGCLSQPSTGQYILDGEDVSNLDKVQLAAVRNKKIGFIFQAYNLLARTSALRNVTLPLLYNHADTRVTLEESDQKALVMLEMVGLSDRVHHQPHELSGGQQQRVAIARALIKDPDILILDEPTSALDSLTENSFIEALKDMIQGRTVFLIAHRLTTVKNVNRILVLNEKRLVAIGSHHELMQANEYYRTLVANQQVLASD